MADRSKIEWTDATWNPVLGCSPISPGCTICYAMRLAGTRLKNHRSRVGLTRPSKAGPVWNGKVRFYAEALLQPLRWRRPRPIPRRATTRICGPTTKPAASIWRSFPAIAAPSRLRLPRRR